MLKVIAAEQISYQQLANAHFRFPYNTPTSKEGYLYPLGTVHHEIHFTVQEGLDAIRDVIYH
ncbi:hypothetical protein CE195_01710, partial [Sodalis-like symbiont of Philaenus spumarius]